MVQVWVLSIFFCVVTGPLSAEVLTRVQASGLGFIAAGDQAGAFAQAKKAAMREAVEIGVGTLLSAETKVSNFAVIADQVLTRTEGYIRSYEILNQGAIDEETYKVEIEAVVELGNLHRRLDALDLLISHAGDPYILCLGRDEYAFSIEGVEVRDFSATVLRGVLKKASGRFNLSAPLRHREDALAEAAEMGFEQGADIVIKSEAMVREAAQVQVPFSQGSLKGLGLYSATADMRIEALWTDTGEVFASLTHTERGADPSLVTAGEKAVRVGTEKLAKELVRLLAENWREKMYSGRLVRLVVAGDRKRIKLFETALSSPIYGVEKFYRRSYEGGIAVIDIRSKDTGFAVARDLSAKGMDGVNISIEKVSPNSVRLELVN